MREPRHSHETTMIYYTSRAGIRYEIDIGPPLKHGMGNVRTAWINDKPTTLQPDDVAELAGYIDQADWPGWDRIIAALPE